MSERPLLFVREASGLAREIGPWSVLFFPLKASLNPWYYWFIAILPFIFPGCDPVISFGLAGLLVIIYGIVLALELLCMPRAGGNYIVVSRGLHPIFGMMEGWRAVIWNPIANATCSFLAAGFLATAIQGIGVLTKSPSLVEASAFWNTTQGTIIIALILIVVGGMIDFFGPGTLKRAMVILSGITVIGTLLMIGLLLSVSPADIPRMWNMAWGQGAYEEIINVAKANGWSPAAFSWDATVAAVLTCRGFLYPDNVSPLAGELSEPRKTILIGIGFSGVILALFAIGASASLMHAYGDFVAAYDYVVMGGYTDQLKINPGLSPSLALFAASLTTDVNIASFVLLIPFISMIGLIPHGYFWTTRPFFALAFDRYVPKIFAHVSDRWHIPTYSWLYCFLMQIIFVFVASVYPIILSISLFILGTLLVIWWSLAGITLPFHRPHIYRRGLKLEIGGFPVMAILGIISAAAEYVVLYTGVKNVDPLSIYITVAIITWAMIMYAVASWYNLKRGIEPEKLFSEVPPE